jgi:hypothetical protein
MNKLTSFSWLFLLMALAGCTPSSLTSENPAEPLPKPTTFQFFEERPVIEGGSPNGTPNPTGIPTVANLFTQRDTPTPKPSATPLPTFPPSTSATGTPVNAQENLFDYYVFDDVLDNNWDVVETIGATTDMQSDIRVFEGENSIAFTPEEDFTSLFFAVKPSSNIALQADKVLGLTFWINGGDDFIQLEQLALSIIGSNDLNYWSPEDDSVALPEGESFSETRLYFLGLNRSIPPNTWVEVNLQLDSLIYDPEYNYVVGFYLKNDLGFRNTVYLDEVKFVLLTDPANLAVEPAFPATTPTAEATATRAATAVAIPTVTPTPTETAETEACVVSPPSDWVQYSIQPGDNIATLAFDRGESAEFVLAANCFRPGVVLSIGQLIWLPPAP